MGLLKRERGKVGRKVGAGLTCLAWIASERPEPMEPLQVHLQGILALTKLPGLSSVPCELQNTGVLCCTVRR